MGRSSSAWRRRASRPAGAFGRRDASVRGGEVACGSLRNRQSILGLLQDLPAAVVAQGDEVLHFIERHALHGKGIGYVDVHLLASAALTEGARLWTRDLKLHQVAAALGCAYPEPAH